MDAFLLPFATHHRFISFALYLVGTCLNSADIRLCAFRNNLEERLLQIPVLTVCVDAYGTAFSYCTEPFCSK